MSSENIRASYTTEFQDDAVSLMIERGYICCETGRRLGINPTNGVRWVRQCLERQEAGEGCIAEVRPAEIFPAEVPRLHWRRACCRT